MMLTSRASLAQTVSPRQPEPAILLDRPQPCPAADSGGQWVWKADLTTFLRDAEFSLPYTRGYTAIGFFLNPTVSRRIGTKGRAEVGLHLSTAAGYDGLHTWQPLVRLEYTPSSHCRIVMGTLYGNLSHGFYEPMLDRERYIYAHQEEGIQILADIPALRWHTDTYLHWENLLEPWQEDQERFTLGSNNEVVPLDIAWGNSRLQVTIPMAFLGSHRGGQFSALDTCIQSLLTESVGLRTALTLGKRHTVTLHAPWFFYQDISPTSWMAYNRGRGFWPQISYDYHKTGQWHGAICVGYWQGNQYIAPRGSYLFQSISWHQPTYTETDRAMITARLFAE